MPLAAFLVEDSQTIRDNLVPALVDLADAEVLGYAESEEEAVDWLQSNPATWQLLIVDLFLKVGSGLGILRRCQRRQPGQRVVVLSNYVNSEIRSRCLALGADAVFDKSGQLDDFFDFCNALGEANR
ncbi:Response regulator receiver domain-containing protein [Burkholderiales bacterium 8X]|nr:Response regulator receiver domain-containing protein [Burkholderiales bacterium 8X]